jgi:His-Xaa-Ser system radical SAM maturase HxsC
MAQKLRTKGLPYGLSRRTLGRVTFDPVSRAERGDYFLAIRKDDDLSREIDSSGYVGLLVEKGAEHVIPKDSSLPVIRDYDDLSFISADSIVAVNPDKGDTFVIYRPESKNNSIFATVRCNSNCLMCSQPPLVSKDKGIVEEHLRLVDLIKEPPDTLGITGGEPTLLKDGLVSIIARLKDRFPDTHIHMLTNGRLYAYEPLVQKLAAVGHPFFVSAIPLYSDVATEHDYVVQARGAFDQTVMGLYHAAKHGLRLEIRVVLHKQTLPRLHKLAEFIYRNLPFVDHIALMGLENMGYVKKNWELLWVDPVDYGDTLERAVKYLAYRRLNVSIYNLQLCVLPRSLWCFARQSISDYKNIYLEECSRCDVVDQCGGLFKSSEARHSRGIKAIRLGTSPISEKMPEFSARA